MLNRYKPTGSYEMIFDDVNAVAYVRELAGAYYAMGYSGKRSKHDFHYKFKTREQAGIYINNWVERLKEIQAYKETQKEKKKAQRANFVNPLQVGDIVYTSWGYEQTNIDFYQVVERKGKSTVMLRQLKCQDVGNEQGHYMSATKIPLKNQFWQDEVLTKRVVPLGENGCCIHISSFETAFVWDGRPKNYSWYG